MYIVILTISYQHYNIISTSVLAINYVNITHYIINY